MARHYKRRRKRYQNLQTCQQTTTYRKNIDNPLVTKETQRTPIERFNIDFLTLPNKNYELTIKDELTKCFQAYTLKDKTSNQLQVLF